ncbi:hypothetical protein RFI_24263, partial [Reticulomyxa filosa]
AYEDEEESQHADGGFGNKGGNDSWAFTNTDKNEQSGWGWDENPGKIDFESLFSEWNLNDKNKDKDKERDQDKNKDKEQDEASEEDTNQNNQGQEQGEDNCVEFTLKPIVELQEVAVDTGHEQESLTASISFKKLYRWGKDVTGEFTWKSRATSSKVEFWQNSKTKKTRITCLEQQTQKLRLNHWIPTKKQSELKKKGENAWTWSAMDETIAAEEKEPQKLTLFSIKFDNNNDSASFEKFFTEAQLNNERDSQSVVREYNTPRQKQEASQNLNQNQDQEKKKISQDTTNVKAIAQVQKNDSSSKLNNFYNQSEGPEEMQRHERNKAGEKAAQLFGNSGGDQMASGISFQFDMASGENVSAFQFDVKDGVDLEFSQHIPKADVSFGALSESEYNSQRDNKESQLIDNANAQSNSQDNSSLGISNFKI